MELGIILLLIIAVSALTFYGCVVSFKANALYGVLSLVVPGFAFIVGTLKLFNVTILK